MLTPNAPRGLCPGCLFKGALETHGSIFDDESTGATTDATVPTPADLASAFPELEILRFIGRGGMGMVYQARQKQLDRMVALKILNPDIASDPAFAERFAREAKMMALLTHPHIVTVYEFGTRPATDDRETGVFFLLMEFVDGLTLRQLITGRQMTAPQALAIVPQICEALQYAHNKGVVHRDIKPENILLDREGRVKIADFGLAKLMGLQSHDLTISTTGQVLGTLNYMAPEQMERPLEVDHRADIYSLGVVFYQMLTGELPLGRFAPPSQKVVMDVRLDEVVMRALEKEPDRRYQQASALQSQVEIIAMTASAVSSSDHFSTTATRRRSSGRTIGSRYFTASIIGLTAVALLIIGLAYASPAVRGSILTLAESPYELKRVTTARVIQAALEKPDLPFAWKELETRQLAVEDANTIMDGVIAWIQRDFPDGMTQPLWYVKDGLNKLDERGLVSDEHKTRCLESLHGPIRGSREARMREGMKYTVTLSLDWRSPWSHYRLFGMVLQNEVLSVTIDGEPIHRDRDNQYSLDWDSADFFQQIHDESLKEGHHKLHYEVLSALALEKDLTGLKRQARSADWPPSKKRWTRTFDVDLVVYAADAVIVSQTQDPALAPSRSAIDVKSITVRHAGNQKHAVFKFDLNTNSLAVPISVDVSLRMAGKPFHCGSMWASHLGTGYTGSDMTFTAEMPELSTEIKEADIVLIPNPQWIETQPGISQMWGKDIVISNVPLRRLDLVEANTNAR